MSHLIFTYMYVPRRTCRKTREPECPSHLHLTFKIISHYHIIWWFKKLRMALVWSMVSVLVIVKKHKWSVQQNLLATGISNYWFLEVVFTKSIWGAALNINWNFCIIEANYDHLHVTRALSNNLRASKMAKKFKKIKWRVWMTNDKQAGFCSNSWVPRQASALNPHKVTALALFFFAILGWMGLVMGSPFPFKHKSVFLIFEYEESFWV